MSDAIVARAGAGLPPGGVLAFAAFHTDQWRETGRVSRFAYAPDRAPRRARRCGVRASSASRWSRRSPASRPRPRPSAATADLRARWEADGRWAAWERFVAEGGRTLTQSRLVVLARRDGARDARVTPAALAARVKEAGSAARLRPGRGRTGGPARPRGGLRGLARRGPCRAPWPTSSGAGTSGSIPGGCCPARGRWSPAPSATSRDRRRRARPGSRATPGARTTTPSWSPGSGRSPTRSPAGAGDGGAGLRGHRPAPRAGPRRARGPGLDRKEHDAAPPGPRLLLLHRRRC